MLRNLNQRKAILVIGDVLLLYLSLFLTSLIRNLGEAYQKFLIQHILPFSILYLLWIAIFYIFELYNLSLIWPKIEFLKRAGAAFSTCLGLGMLFFYLVPVGITPKTNLLLDILISPMNY